MKNALFNNTLLTFFRQLLSIGLGLLVVIIMARVLGTERQGVYAFMTLIPIASQTLFSMGVPLSTVYYVGQGKYASSLIAQTNIWSSLLIGSVAFLLSLLYIYLFPNQSSESVSYSVLVVVLLTVMPIMVYKNILAYFQGLEDFRVYNMLAVLNQLLLFVFTVLFLLVGKMGLRGALLAFVITHFSIFIISIGYLWAKQDIAFVYDKSYWWNSLQFGIRGHISNIVAFFNYRIDLFIIAYYLDNASIGLYSIAVSIVERIWVVSHAVSSVVYARLAHIKTEQAQVQLTAKVGRIVLFVSVVLGGVLALLAVGVVPLVFGEAYTGTIMPLLILIPGVLLISVARIFSNFLTAYGKPEINSYIAVGVLVFNVLLNVLLIPSYGIIGAAWATTMAYALNMLLKTIIFLRYSQLKPAQVLWVKKSDINTIIQRIRIIANLK